MQWLRNNACSVLKNICRTAEFKAESASSKTQRLFQFFHAVAFSSFSFAQVT